MNRRYASISQIRLVKLGGVASFIRGITFKPSDLLAPNSPNSVACMRTKNVQVELDLQDVWQLPKHFVRRAEQFLQPGDILVSSANSWNLVGKCCFVGHLAVRSTFGGFVCVLRSLPQHIDSRFLYHWFSCSSTQAIVRTFGQQSTNISNLNIERCRQLLIPLPPLPEQRRIADILDRAEALRAKRRAALAQLDELTRAIFLDMFGEGAVYHRVSLEALAAKERHAFSSGPFGSNLTSKDYVDSPGILVIRGLNVSGGEVSLQDCRFVSKAKAHELSRSAVKSGDILVVAVGSSGLACLIPPRFPEAVMSQNFNKITPDLTLVEPVYLCTALRTNYVQQQLNSNTTDTVRTFLSLTKLKTVLVPLPPLSLQQEFARRVQAIDRLKTLHRQSLAQLDALFQSLQHRAFRGEL